MTLKQRLQLAMAQRRLEERARKAELNRLDNEDCGEEEEEEEMTDESEEEEVRGCVVSHRCGAIKSLLCFCPFFTFHFYSSFVSQGVDDLLGGDDGEKDEVEEEEEGRVAQIIRSLSPVPLNGPSPTPDLVNTDGTLMLFPGSSCSRTGLVCICVPSTLSSYHICTCIIAIGSKPLLVYSFLVMV